MEDIGAVKSKGFSLIELVVVVGLVGLLSVALVNMFLASTKGAQRARLQAEIKSQGDYALASMERVLRNAVSVPSGCSSTSSRSLEVLVRSPGSSGHNETYRYYYNSNGNHPLMVQIDNGTARALISPPVVMNQDDVSFVCPSASEGEVGRIEVKLTLRAGDSSIPAQTFQTTVSIRNNP